jgi:glycerol-3-phosphate dehydrogenase (NAD(P)+)
MTAIAILGSGAFGTALAIALSDQGNAVTLWARSPEQARQMTESRQNAGRLPGIALPGRIRVTSDLGDVQSADVILFALPMQALRQFLALNAARIPAVHLVACCKGVDLATGQGPTALIAAHCPRAHVAVLTGPSFAVDIARGLPTALTLACADESSGAKLQTCLSTPVLRLYRTTDVTGAELGGALKNVVAIAAGIVIGAGLGDSARAALMTRGYAEMVRLASAMGARSETLSGLSGFGDLVLTCTSAQSRNFRFGQSLGQGSTFDPSVTVEGAATAVAVTRLAKTHGLDMPIATMVSAVTSHEISIAEAVKALLSRPLKQE